MLAKRRSLMLNGNLIERTPLLVPSFSSKGFGEVSQIVEYMSDTIVGPMLVSAYDLHYKKLAGPFDYSSLVFLDSGGYEASRNLDLSDIGEREHATQTWSQPMHEGILSKWNPKATSVLISYDHPSERQSLKDQVKRAHGMAKGRTGFLREILLKPETAAQRFLQVDEVVKNVRLLNGFDVIGVTEKEVGNSILARMVSIAKIRQALDKAKLDIPIHVFGSLDTVTTPLYFLAGADIFDGLTWLRFAFHEGKTIYKQNYGATELGLDTTAAVLDGRCWNHNYYYLTNLQLEMRRYLSKYDMSVFKLHELLFKSALDSTLEAIGG
jgi:hypothetical protein